MPHDPHIWELRVTLDGQSIDQLTELLQATLTLQKAGINVDVFPVYAAEVEEITHYDTPRPKRSHQPPYETNPGPHPPEVTQIIEDIPTFNGSLPAPNFRK